MRNYIKAIELQPHVAFYAAFDPTRRPLGARTRFHFFDDENETETAEALAYAANSAATTKVTVSVFSRPAGEMWAFVPEVAQWGSAHCAAA